ncbi:helix-turn-helix domain-containing protein [Acinetobacter baumannii]|jgi:transcriptional regulator with XRE-family HTH domain|uniref:Helix-turn-helix transcriptional regulator n=1 Tax=Acinetobacter oleivorans TaxID=1148157 RepID=A0ABR9NP19_9GAMM|nr:MULTISPECIES: helix-turn-helix transcriptional regulator [Acinetobacter]MDA4916992.1 helix-turn-helix transcriptional regulator [Acinetobacter baumannii]MBE2166449.1 helix-turn-helix transcriptional regulator [Acinetobacter oleivorans]MBN6522080.1 helix-turn-helix transcriptional regulator [Acinetobacter pittii]MDS7924570.1 helix-turn-helix transcriptional regulator [Acinetobacter sp. V115_6]WQF74880.1 helix-turn-helix transcriptional regulator [Acinetobacter oleivorans]
MSSIHDPRYIGLIKCLISIREEKNITQVELASFLRKPQSYIAKVENFDRRIDILELNDWLKAMDSKLSEFIAISNIENI